MTVHIEQTKIPITSVIKGFSRYRNQNVIYYGERRYITFDTYIRRKYVPSGQERVMVINKGVEYRPDLVAYDIFSTPDAWWKILEANGMQDIWEFKAGKTIIIPESIL